MPAPYGYFASTVERHSGQKIEGSVGRLGSAGSTGNGIENPGRAIAGIPGSAGNDGRLGNEGSAGRTGNGIENPGSAIVGIPGSAGKLGSVGKAGKAGSTGNGIENPGNAIVGNAQADITQSTEIPTV